MSLLIWAGGLRSGAGGPESTVKETFGVGPGW